MTDPIEAAAIALLSVQHGFGRDEAIRVWPFIGSETQASFRQRAESIIAAYHDLSVLTRLLELITELNQVAHSRGGIEAMHTLDALVAQAKKFEPSKEGK